MRVGFAVNHAYPHVGGCEKVIQEISEGLINKGHSCIVFARTVSQQKTHNQVEYMPVGESYENWKKELEKQNLDILFIYSDVFKFCRELLLDKNSFNFKMALALVGCNGMFRSSSLKTAFLNNCYQDFLTIVHSDYYKDYKFCNKHSIPITVIPNGVSLEEFSVKRKNLRDKFGIGNKHILLCISNFFPGKGQEHLLPILRFIERENKAFHFVSISAETPSKFSTNARNRFKNLLKRQDFDSTFLVGIPREEVVQWFLNSDIFVFPSQTEVAPLVLLESMAAKLPWVSLAVGNARKLSGGLVVNTDRKNHDGILLYSGQTYKNFTDSILKLMNDSTLRKIKGQNGYEMVKNNFNIKEIINTYERTFLEFIQS